MSEYEGWSPAEVDTRLYELYVEQSKAAAKVARAWYSIHQEAGDKKIYSGRSWSMTNDEAYFKAGVKATNPNAMPWETASAKRAQDSLASAKEEVAKIEAKMAPLDEEWIRRGRWTRAFLVTNGDGHVHSSMNCSSCNRGQSPTQFQWMTEFSAHSEAEIVAAAGWRACTICYPSAPVSQFKTAKAAQSALPTTMFSEEDKRKETAKAEREAAKAARVAKAKANAPTASGEPLEIRLEPYEGTYRGEPWTYYRLSETFKTERAAMMWATDQFFYSGPTATEQAAIKMVAEAVAEKRGVEAATVLAEIETKGRKKAGK